MWILDQSKNNFVNSDRIINIGIEEKSTLTNTREISAQTDGYTVILGQYKSKKRTDEVFQALIKAIALNSLDGVSPEIGNLLINFKKITSYEMPKE